MGSIHAQQSQPPEKGFSNQSFFPPTTCSRLREGQPEHAVLPPVARRHRLRFQSM